MELNFVIVKDKLCGRIVKRIKFDKMILKCADCGKPTKYLIIEKKGIVWGYCGICEVG